MTYPAIRMHRARKSPQIRTFLAETSLQKNDFISPIFVNEKLEMRAPVQSMPGIFQESPLHLLNEVERRVKLGLNSFILFGIPKEKDEIASSAHQENGVIQTAIRSIKKYFPHTLLIADCCLCEYTSHAHCGVHKGGHLQNDETLEILKKTALSYADAGIDIIAPSGSMDGVIGALREVLDANGHEMVSLMSYAIKYASSFYGPFREAAGSSGLKGDRKHYQLQPAQKREALRDALLDVNEGADYLIVKPGLPYLDIIHSLKEKTLLPIVSYQVSGEYSMIKAAAEKGYLNEVDAFYETLISLKRAGSDFIISYYADEIAKRL